jgi:TolB-like protein/Tfp pilus assembly protein PilF
MTESFKAVFLSYASQDAEAARRICEVLRAAGIEVWFDQSELRGGDVWDHTIRQQIHDCSLFVPVISAHTDARAEGYFRLEWKLAVDRSYLMADDAAFLFPVVIDATTDALARVPEKFRAVQWTRLPAGETPAAFPQRVSALLAGTAKPSPGATVAGPARPATQKSRPARQMAIAAIAVLAVGAIALLSWREMTRPSALVQKVAATAASVIPEHSIAVLPFSDLSASKDQEYFSDGLAEELLNLLSKVPGLQVAARTSAFSFKGHAVDVPTIGRQLMVAHVLEGSVRKVGNHLRVTAQLERADNGYQIWSETYDRELGDVFRIQDEISAAVVKALKVSLLGAAPPRATGTQSPDAYLVFLQGRAKMATGRLADAQQAAADFARVIKLDPNYGPAYVELATAKLQVGEYEVTDKRQSAFEAAMEEAKVLIEEALVLDPKNAQAYIERGYIRAFSDPAGAEKDYRRGIELNPNSARGYSALATLVFEEDPTRRDEALAMITRAQQLDPLQPEYDVLKATALVYGRGDVRNADALLTDVVAHHPLYKAALIRLSDVREITGHFADAAMYNEQALKLDPLAEWARRALVTNYVLAGDFVAARQVTEEAPHRLPIQRVQLVMHEGDWHQAAQISYTALNDGTMLENSSVWAVFAIRMDARRSGDYRQARAALEKMSGVTWSANGIPTVPTELGLASSTVALGDVLIASGDRAPGERVLRASLADMNYVIHDLKRGDFWYSNDQAIALALLGDTKGSLAALRKAVSAGIQQTLWPIEIEPAFSPAMRGDPDFQALVRETALVRVRERHLLDQLRAAGRIPNRAPPAPPMGWTSK